MANKPNLDAYFERIGFSGSIAPTLETLTQLHAMHPAAIPYENLDPLMGAPVRLELANLQQKLLFDRRGGYCFEQNTLFRAMLQDLDFEVKTHAARVLWNTPPDIEPPMRHMVLTVDIAGVSYLCDVGFGGQTATAPLRMRKDVEQETPLEPYRLLEVDGTWTAEVQIEEVWRPLFSFELEERDDAFIGEMSSKAASSAFFTENLLAARSDKDRRQVIWNTRFNTHSPGTLSEARLLGSVVEMREALAGPFGIALPADERLDAALQKIVDRGPE